MWHRADEPRQGRAAPDGHLADPGDAPRRPGAHLRAAAHQRGDRLQPRAGRDAHLDGRRAARRAGQPGLRGVDLPADPGAALQLRRGHPAAQRDRPRFNTGSMRNIYSPDVRTRQRAGRRPARPRRCARTRSPFRLEFLKDDAGPGSAREGRRGRQLGPDDAGRAPPRASRSTRSTRAPPPSWSRSTAVPRRSTGRSATRVTGPRVTKAVVAVDAGLVVNPRGLKAQMMGGFSDGLALALTSSVHLKDGHFLEASWDNYFYTRQWNIPPEFERRSSCTPTSEQPGGAGEAGVAASCAAVACAYAPGHRQACRRSSRSTTTSRSRFEVEDLRPARAGSRRPTA